MMNNMEFATLWDELAEECLDEEFERMIELGPDLDDWEGIIIPVLPQSILDNEDISINDVIVNLNRYIPSMKKEKTAAAEMVCIFYNDIRSYCKPAICLKRMRRYVRRNAYDITDDHAFIEALNKVFE